MNDQLSAEYVEELKARIKRYDEQIAFHEKWVKAFEEEKARDPSERTTPAERIEFHIAHHKNGLVRVKELRHLTAQLIGLGQLYPKPTGENAGDGFPQGETAG